jgi:hypothetical protein
LNRELKPFLKMTIVQKQRLNYFTSIAEHPVNINGHVKVVNVLPLRCMSLDKFRPNGVWIHVE